ncbi:MAG: TIGR03936 family radical SAM-associated protein [Acidimicrobiia bacterium]
MRGDVGFPVRLRFTKVGKVRFVSHRDVARALERAFRIEQLPLAFTLGFSPRPKVSFGLALGVGHESVAEYLDLELADAVDVDALPARISPALPDGIDVAGACDLTGRAPSLQEAVTAVEIELRLVDVDAAVLTEAVERVLSADTLPTTTTRKGRTVVEDLRPALRSLVVHADDGTPVVHADVNTQPRGLRPADLVTALRDLAAPADGVGEDRVLRTHQWIERDGARLEPLEADRATRTATRLRVTSKGLTNDRRDHSGGDGLRADEPGTPSAGTRRIA